MTNPKNIMKMFLKLVYLAKLLSLEIFGNISNF